MDNTDQLTSIWKSNELILENETHIESPINTKNVMDTIIEFEKQEKKEKKSQIAAAFVLTIITIFFLYPVELTKMHFIGMSLLITGIAYSIIANRTDNFPDFKQLNTQEYLLAYKNNTLNRTRMHWMNSFIGLIFLVPGCYLTYRDSFPQLGNWWMPIMAISALITGVIWFIKYNKRSKLVLNQIINLIEEFK